MTIDAIEESCLQRKDKISDLDERQKASALKYEGRSFAMDGQDFEVAKGSKKNFDDLPRNFDHSMLQLQAIDQYLRDFRMVVDKRNAKIADEESEHLRNLAR
jgi:predicted neutral ceramidase superfamily lipid hydrolase